MAGPEFEPEIVMDSDSVNGSDGSLSDTDNEGIMVEVQPNVVVNNVNAPHLESGYESEGLRLPISDDEADGILLPAIAEVAEDNVHVVEFTIGMRFATLQDVRVTVREYALHGGYNIRFDKNDKMRVRVKCAEGCNWFLFVAPMNNFSWYQVKRVTGVHSCSRTFSNKQASRKTLVKHILPIMQQDYTLTTSQVVKWVQRTFKIKITSNLAYRIRIKCYEKIHGTYVQQYAKLRDYALEILRSNPTTSCVVKTMLNVSNLPVFERMYVCLPGVREGFKHCRPFLCVDGCFLKGYNTNQFLCAVGRDANEQFYPIAFAVVEQEFADSWEWFLNLLFRDIGPLQQNNWVIMSDRQKGLNSLLNAWGVEHRYCVMHLYSNYRKLFHTEELKKLLWKAAKASYIGRWRTSMNAIKALNLDAWNQLMKIPTKYWCVHAFGPRAKTNAVTNNMSETFNSVILEARELPIVSMMEWLLRYLMCRLRSQEAMMVNYVGDVCPNVNRKIIKLKAEAGKNCHPQHSGYGKYLVTGKGEQYNVNLEEKTCTCGLWQVTGIPCEHRISSIHSRREKVEDYVLDYFKPATFMKIYAGMVNGTNGKEQWPTYSGPDLVPPPMTKRPGRPKKSRKRKPDEPSSSSKPKRPRSIQLCNRCGNPGHNMRSCKQPFGGDISNVSIVDPIEEEIIEDTIEDLTVNPVGSQVGSTIEDLEGGTSVAVRGSSDRSRAIRGRGVAGVRGRGMGVVRGRGVAGVRGRGTGVVRGRGASRARGRGTGVVQGRGAARVDVSPQPPVNLTQESQAFHGI